MYDPLMSSNPIRPTDSSKFDKATKIITYCFVLIGIVLSIVISILHSYVDVNSNTSEYSDQVGLIKYIADNVNATPIKHISFRELYCDATEETTSLFPWKGNSTLNHWNQQLICLERYKTMEYVSSTGTCATGATQCGEYCLPSSEGKTCPISKIQIRTAEDADETLVEKQNLSDYRTLYIWRETSLTSQGMYELEVAVDMFPCINSRRKNLGGIEQVVGVEGTETKECDEYGNDVVNSVRVEQMLFADFLKDNLDRMNETVPSSIKPSSIAYLTSRMQIKSKKYNLDCNNIDYSKIYAIQDQAENIEEIGFIYMIIKGIVCVLLFIIIIMEFAFLKCRIHWDLKIVTVLLKILTIVLFSFFLLEGGLMIHQISQKNDIEVYYKDLAKCFPQTEVSTIFSNFPNLFSSDLSIFIDIFFYCMILIGSLECILVILYICQMIKWCLLKRHNVQLKPRRLADDEFQGVRQNIQLTKESGVPTDRDHQGTPQFEMTNLNARKISRKY